jgi:hypothetical protein
MAISLQPFFKNIYPFFFLTVKKHSAILKFATYPSDPRTLNGTVIE